MPTVTYERMRPYMRIDQGVPKPVIRARLFANGNQTVDFLAVVDSGADRSVFHTDFALKLGFDLNALPVSQARGVGGDVECREASVEILIEDKKFKATVIFCSHINQSIALLGREDAFRQFRFGFDQKAQSLLISRYK